MLNTVKDGDIVLMHDIHSTTIDAALELIPKLVDQGYQLVTVSELAESKRSRIGEWSSVLFLPTGSRRVWGGKSTATGRGI